MACLNGNMGGGLEMMPPAMTTTFDAPPSAQAPFMGAQLPRSKSLNDISYDSQISAFASDRFINNLPNLNSNNNNNDHQAIIANGHACLDDARSYKTDGLAGQVNAPMANGMHILNSNMYGEDLATATNCVDSIYSQRQLSHSSNQQHNLVPIDGLQNHMAQQQQSLYNHADSQLNFNRLNSQQQHLPVQNDLNRNLNSNQFSNSIRGNLFAQNTQAGPATNEFNICNPLAMNMNGLTEQIGNLQL